MSDFGVIIGCCRRDLHYAYACYASIQHFMPGTGVCFLYDGDSEDRRSDLPHASWLTRQEVVSEDLRRKSFGPGLTKMVALFESPFETFLYLDADTTVVGDLRHHLGKGGEDFVVDYRGRYSDEEISRWFLNIEEIGAVLPDFDWAKHRSDYFCTGTFFARRGAIREKDYLSLLQIAEEHPKLFRFWEMGLLNYMIFQGEDAGRLQVKRVPYQLVTIDHDARWLQDEYDERMVAGGHGDSGRSATQAYVFHYPVTKPHMHQRKSFTRPMTDFRKHFRRVFVHQGPTRTWIEMFWEDLVYEHWKTLRFKLVQALRWLYRATGLRSCFKKPD